MNLALIGNRIFNLDQVAIAHRIDDQEPAVLVQFAAAPSLTLRGKEAQALWVMLCVEAQDGAFNDPARGERSSRAGRHGEDQQ